MMGNSKIPKLADRESCTACGACISGCPRNAIGFRQDEYGSDYPAIDETLCVDCVKCEKVCHALNDRDYRFPLHAYAAWSKDEETHEKAASGGIASEIYGHCIEQGIFVMGTHFDRREGVTYKPVKEKEDIRWARNSKYIQPHLTKVFEMYSENLKNEQEAVFIGLPCHVAALKRYLVASGIDASKLVVIDLICHGVPSYEYWMNHLSHIEEKHGEIRNVSFRGPHSVYILRCYSTDGRVVYQKDMHGDDTYYRAFCENLNFRENCYHCAYARYERISDMTLGDYSGLGQIWSYKGRRDMVSVVLANTDKGVEFLKKIEGIELVERNICEPPSAKGNQQLREPAHNRKRQEFLITYRQNGGGVLRVTKKPQRRCFEGSLSYGD